MPSLKHEIRAVLLALLLAVCLALALFIPNAITAPNVHVGDVASSSFLAPYDFSYVDANATAARRQAAAAAAPEQFVSSTVEQSQAVSQLTALLSAVPALQASGRGGTTGEKANALIALAPNILDAATAAELLNLSQTKLSHVQTLVLNALNFTSRQPVTQAQVSALKDVPPFPVSEPKGVLRDLAARLYADFLRSNRLPDPLLTTKAKQSAAAAVHDVSVSYKRDQVIVRLGDVVTEPNLAALQAAGLADSRLLLTDLVADFLVGLVVAGLLHGYLMSIRSPILIRPRRVLLLDGLLLGAVVTSTFVLQGHGVLPYVFPTATLGMLVTVLLDAEVSVVAAAMWAVLAGWFVGGSFEITTYYLLTGVTGGLLVRSVRRSSEFFVAGFSASGVGLLSILAFKLLNQGYDWFGLSTYIVGVLVSGVLAAALTLGSLSGLGRIFGVTTGLHLLELSHPNHPLLRRLMQEAPGTYHHSMMIGTLAERAAEQIGADPLLVRVVAYFHDIGKLVSPPSFAENQAGIANVHEHLEPKQSVDLIMQHIYEGVRLARQFHLPEVLEDGIWQHHGTNLVGFFYQQAVAMYGEADTPMEEYRYPGPKPQSREMAILMLADGVEAAVRASPGIDGDQIRAIIHRIAQERLQDGQFDECNVTLRDLAIIQESFAIVLQGLSHPRVQYPAPVPAAIPG